MKPPCTYSAGRVLRVTLLLCIAVSGGMCVKVAPPSAPESSVELVGPVWHSGLAGTDLSAPALGTAADGPPEGSPIALGDGIVLVARPELDKVGIFRLSDGVEQQMLSPPPEEPLGILFGSAVAVSGSLIGVGAKGGASYEGIAYAFLRDPATGLFSRSYEMRPPSGSNAHFGASVAVLNGSVPLVLVGAPQWAGGEMPTTGAAFLFSVDEADGQASRITTLRPSHGSGGERMGQAVALYHTLAVVGAPGEGTVYVFSPYDSKDPTGGWGQIGTVFPTANQPLGQANFGAAVALSGRLLVVGAPSASVGQVEGAGMAFVFVDTASAADTLGNDDVYDDEMVGRRLGSGPSYQQRQALSVPGTPDQSTSFGASVSVSWLGTVAVAGNGGRDGRFVSRVYEPSDPGHLSGSAWVQVAELEAVPPTGAAAGVNPAVQGATVALPTGSAGADPAATVVATAEGVTLYAPAAPTIIPAVALQPGQSLPAPVPADAFGHAVAVSVAPPLAWPSLAVVGAPQADHRTAGTDAGAAYVYYLQNGWRLGVVERGGDLADAHAHFGEAVAVSCDPTFADRPSSLGTSWVVAGLVVVSAPQLSIDDSPAGVVFVFEANYLRLPPSSIRLVRRATLQATTGGSGLGTSLAIVGSALAVGAPTLDVNVTRGGGVQMYDFNSVEWLPGQLLTHPEQEPGDGLGWFVAARGDVLAAAAPRYAGDSGVVYVYWRDPASSLWVPASGMPLQEPSPGERGPLGNDDTDDNGSGFGRAVAISADPYVLVVGAPLIRVGDVYDHTAAGSAFVYVPASKSAPGGAWRFAAELRRNDAGSAGATDGFGAAVAVAGGAALVSAPRDHGAGSRAPQGAGYYSTPAGGAVYVFTPSNPTQPGQAWQQASRMAPSPGGTGAGTDTNFAAASAGPFGYRVAASEGGEVALIATIAHETDPDHSGLPLGVNGVVTVVSPSFPVAPVPFPAAQSMGISLSALGCVRHSDYVPLGACPPIRVPHRSSGDAMQLLETDVWSVGDLATQKMQLLSPLHLVGSAPVLATVDLWPPEQAAGMAALAVNSLSLRHISWRADGVAFVFNHAESTLPGDGGLLRLQPGEILSGNAGGGFAGEPEIVDVVGQHGTMRRLHAARTWRGRRLAPSVAAGQDSTVLQLRGCFLEGGSALRGGCVAALGGELVADGTTISGCLAATGGGLYAGQGAVVDINRSHVTGNVAEVLEGGGIAANTASVTITESGLTRNHAAAGGGAVSASFRSTLEVRGSMIVSNTAKGGGGGLLASAALVRVKGSTIEENQAMTGGGTYAEAQAHVVVAASTVAHNVAHDEGGGGGGLGFRGGSNGTVLNCTIQGNLAMYVGGGVAAGDPGTSVALVGGLILENESRAQGGGALVGVGASAEVTDVVVRGNRAVSGGGIALVSEDEPGGLMSRAVLVGAVLDNNKAGDGGGLYCSNSAAELLAATLGRNTATTRGGGAAASNCDLSLTNTTVSGNAVTGQGNKALTDGGGGLYATTGEGAGAPSVVIGPGTTITGNTARRGAGVVLETAGPNCTAATPCEEGDPNSALTVTPGATVDGGVLWVGRPPVLPPSTREVSSAPVVVALKPGSTFPAGATSGQPLGDFQLVLLDVFRNVSQPIADATVAVSVDAKRTAGTGNGTVALLSGTTLSVFDVESGAVAFSGLAVSARPNSTVYLRFALNKDDSVRPLEVSLQLHPCPAGTALAASNLTCDPCPSGSHSPRANVDAAACRRCVGGVSSPGSATCSPCDAGTEPGPDGRCTACNATSTSRGVLCVPCGPGSVPDAEDRALCTPCGAGEVRPSTSSRCGPCPKGHFAAPDGVTCVQCPPEGVTCSKGVLTMLPGFWISPLDGSDGTNANTSGLAIVDEATTFYECPDDACVRQPDGSVGCAPGRTGVLCAVCLDRHYRQGTQCLACPDGSGDWPILVTVVGLLLALSGVTVWRSTSMWQRPTTNPDFDVMPCMKIFLNFLQVMGFMSDFSIPWPSFVASMWSTSESVSSVPVSTSFVTCTLGSNFYDRFWALATAPATAAVLFLIIPIVGVIKHRRFHWGSYRTAVLVSWFLLYPSVSRQVVQTLDCSQKIDGKSYLEASFNDECGTTKHTLHVVAALVVMAVFCAGFPLVTAWVLRSKQKAGLLSHHDTRKHLLFLYQGYRDETCWWEAVTVGRKFALACAGAALGGTGRGHQAYVATLVLSMCLVAQLLARPFASASQGRLETVSLVTSCLSLYLGQLFVLGGLGETGEAFAVAFLVCINVGFVVWMLYQLGSRIVGNVRARRGQSLLSDAKATLRPVPRRGGKTGTGGIELLEAGAGAGATTTPSTAVAINSGDTANDSVSPTSAGSEADGGETAYANPMFGRPKRHSRAARARPSGPAAATTRRDRRPRTDGESKPGRNGRMSFRPAGVRASMTPRRSARSSARGGGARRSTMRRRADGPQALQDVTTGAVPVDAPAAGLDAHARV